LIKWWEGDNVIFKTMAVSRNEDIAQTMYLADVAKPGLMVSQTWPQSREREGETLRAVETALSEGFFRALQTVEVPYPQERKKIASVIRAHGVVLTYCLTRVLNENGLNLSSLDEQLRQKSVRHAVLCLEHAREIGAQSVHIVSGPAPEEYDDRPKALARLSQSLVELSHSAAIEPGLKIIIEPLDIRVHKKGTLGLVNEAIELADELRILNCDLQLCLDTAHLILNDEDPLTALQSAHDRTAELHFCNCVTDKGHRLYGDHHIRFGKPGRLDLSGIAAIMAGAMRCNFFSRGNRPGVFCEVLKRPEDESIEVMHYCRKTLESAWTVIRSG
jgi:sugar phosphate isomerase/epimerase